MNVSQAVSSSCVLMTIIQVIIAIGGISTLGAFMLTL
jgi:hypothetical protein